MYPTPIIPAETTFGDLARSALPDAPSCPTAPVGARCGRPGSPSRPPCTPRPARSSPRRAAVPEVCA